MYTPIKFSAEVGTFHYNQKLIFADPSLVFPLVNTTLIGRAATEFEQGICDGGLVGLVFDDRFNNGGFQVSFIERPSFDGKKIIIPNDPHRLNRWISREHGRIHHTLVEQNYGSLSVTYTHMSKSGMRTQLWSPEDGMTLTATNEGDQIELNFPKNAEESSRYLLIGGRNQTKTPDATYPHYAFYIKLTKIIPADMIKK